MSDLTKPAPDPGPIWFPALEQSALARTRREHAEAAEALLANITVDDRYGFHLVAATMAVAHAMLATSMPGVADRL